MELDLRHDHGPLAKDWSLVAWGPAGAVSVTHKSGDGDLKSDNWPVLPAGEGQGGDEEPIDDRTPAQKDFDAWIGSTEARYNYKGQSYDLL